MRKDWLALGMMFSLLFLLVGCGGLNPPANQAPQIQSTSPANSAQTVIVGGSLNLSVTATDSDQDILTYTWSNTGGQLSSTTGTQVTWTAPATVGQVEVTVTVSDGAALDTFKWVITVQGQTDPNNQAPEIDSVTPADAVQTVQFGNTLALSVIASDPDQDPLTYSWSSTGGQLSSTTGTQVTWTAPSQEGQVSVTVTVSDGALQDTHTWTITVSSDAVNEAIYITEDITTITTWETGKVYVIDGYIYVTAGLVIQPGTIIKFGNNYRLSVSETGLIKAEGTLEQPIIFTSIKDDSFGGDTNQDGSLTAPAAGEWQYISVETNSGSIFDYCEFYYGGSNYYDHTLYLGSDTNTKVTNSTFAYNKGGYLGVISAYMASSGTVIANNTFYANEKPMYINPMISLDDTNQFHKPEDETVTNTYNGIFIDSVSNEITNNVTWNVTEVPIVLEGSQFVATNASLTLGDGVVLKFGPGDYLNVGGVIIANGATKGIVFTSYKDDAHGGDTNGDGNITTPAVADWENVSLGYQSNSIFNNCSFFYSGEDGYAALYLGENISTVTNCTFAHNKGSYSGALDASSSLTGTIIQNNIFYDNDRPLYIGFEIDIDDSNQFHNPADSTETNLKNGIFVDGITVDMTTARTWAETEVPFVMEGDLGIASGGSLTLADNVIIKFTEYDSISHYNNLVNYNGTGVYFTSYRDDSLGGDTNGDGSTTTPVVGDWDGVYNSVSYQWESWPNVFYAGN